MVTLTLPDPGQNASAQTTQQPPQSPGRRAMRTRLPNRRPSKTATVAHDGRDYAVTISFDPSTGIVREVFAGDSKTGSAMDAILNDACVALSLLLQHDVEPAALAHSMGRIDNGAEPASVIGALVDHLATQEARP